MWWWKGERLAAVFDQHLSNEATLCVAGVDDVYWAAMLARQWAVEALVPAQAHVLVDGKRRI